MKARRTKMKIYIDILRSIQKDRGKLKKTHIVHKANLTHSRLENYMDFLLSEGFVKRDKKGREIFFILTDKGREFLGEINKLKKISEAFGVPF